MRIIGITGGIGAGKSKVLEYLKDAFGAKICQADEVARDLQKKGQECHTRIVEHFGNGILTPEGELDRKELGHLVFADQKKLQWLNETVHPEVKRYIAKAIEEERKKGTKLFIIEAALLIEDHYDAICDELWYIHTSENVRRERLKQSRGYTDEKIDTILRAQLAEETFRMHCSAVIDNSGTFENTKKQVGELI